MKNNATYFKIGLFVLAGCAIFIAGLLYISADTIRGDMILVETYVDESVLGLSVGSPVMHRGVTIGQVQKITFAPLEYPMDVDSPEFKAYSRYVVVIMAIDLRKFPGLKNDPVFIETMIRNQIKGGLRFKLSYQGITGISFMEADYMDPVRNLPLPVPWQPKNLYIPSAPSLITSFTQALDNVFRRLEKVDIESALAKMETTLTAMDQAIQDAKIGEVRESFIALTDEIRESNRKLQPFLIKTETLPEDFNTAIEQFTVTMRKMEGLLSQSEPDIETVLGNLKTLSRNLKYLSESLKNDPAQLILSSPPKRSEVVE